jgi:5-methylcytosine-specific restriction endonuclease McrA
MQRTTDRRYHTKRWQRVRLRVLNRDGWICRAAQGCPKPASVADHIIPVYGGMPDDLYFGPGNLRAACRNHHLARGLTEHLHQDAAVITRDYS